MPLRALALALALTPLAAAQPVAELAPAASPALALDLTPGASPAAWAELPAAPLAGRSRAPAALALSVGATAAGFGMALVVQEFDAGSSGTLPMAGLTMAAVGLMMGPSAGNLWLGETRDAAIGAGLRALGAGGVLYSLGSYSDDECYEEVCPEPSSLPERAMTGGLVLLAGGLVYDLATQVRNGAPGRVRVAPSGAGAALTVAL